MLSTIPDKTLNSQAESTPSATAATEDLTGRNRLTKSVLSGWGGHLVFILAGFIMPRLIDAHVGQTALGIWDFCWSVVSYFGLAQVGVGSSINRYVAKYRAIHDVDGLRCAVSSVVCIQIVSAGVAVGLTAGATWSLPLLFGQRLGADAHVASSVVALLGASLVVQCAFDAFRGVITGCHRWDLHNQINAGSHAATTAGMIVSLALGYGLPGLAVVNLCGVTITEFLRMMVAYRVCPELRIRLGYAKWSQARRMLVFGGKTMIDALSRLLLVQANSILVASFLGPGALAVYSRPGALVRHVEVLVNKFAFVLSPTASSLQGGGRHAELRELLIDSTRFGVSLTLPMILTLVVFGDPILHVWMGPRYEHGLILAILAAGSFLPIVQQPAVNILVGLNLHGRVGFATLIVAICGILVTISTIGTLGWGLVGAALAVTIPATIGNGTLIPIYACRRLKIPLGDYVKRAYLGPVACSLPFALCLVASRLLFGDRPLLSIIAGCSAGALVLAPLYWRYILSPRMRLEIQRFLRRTPAHPAASSCVDVE